MFCVNCGGYLDDDAKVCPNCGCAVIEEGEQADSVNYGRAPAAGPVNNPVQGGGQIVNNRGSNAKSKKLGIIIGALIAVIIILAVNAFIILKLGILPIGSKDKEPEYPGIYYLADNEFYFSSFNGKNKVEIDDDIYDDWSDSSEYSDYTYRFTLSDDGKKIYFAGNTNGNTNTYDLFVTASTGKGDPVRLASDVKSYRLIGKKDVLYKDADNSLYITDGKNKNRIAKDVTTYNTDESEKYVLWLDDNNSLYYQDLSFKTEKERIDKDVSAIEDVSDKLGRIVYSKYSEGTYDYYIVRNRGEKEKLIANVSGARVFIQDGKVCAYYTKEKGGSSTTLMDFVEDDFPGDASIKEPNIDDYTTYENVNSFWGPTTREIVDDKYYEELEKYKEKAKRDSFRQALSERPLYMDNSVVYFVTEGSEEVQIDSGLIEIVGAESLDKGMVLTYVTFDISKAPKIKLSDVMNSVNYDEEIELNFFSTAQLKIANGKSVANLDFGDITVGDIDIYGGDEYVFAIVYDAEDEYEEEGELYRIGTKGNSLGEVTKVASEVESICEVESDNVYYALNYDDKYGEFDLYCNKDKIDSAVMQMWMISISDKGTYYFKDYDSSDAEGDLYVYKNGKAVKIANEVHSFYPYSKNVTAILTSYNTKTHMGDLKVYDGKNIKKIATDVNAIVY